MENQLKIMETSRGRDKRKRKKRKASTRAIKLFYGKRREKKKVNPLSKLSGVGDNGTTRLPLELRILSGCMSRNHVADRRRQKLRSMTVNNEFAL
jgi:hypothetical protein